MSNAASGPILHLATTVQRLALSPDTLAMGQLCHVQEVDKHYRWDGTTWDEFAEGGVGSGAPTDADYLVGTAHADLSAEIVVGTSPGGELGGTWGTPTVDATHSGSTHAATQAAAEATASSALTTHEADTSTHGATVVAGTEDITFETLDAAGDVGTGAAQVAQGSHAHAGAGHTIADAGAAETQRATLDFQDGFIVTDNAGANSTDVDLDYGTGATQPAAGDHTHAGGGAPADADYLVGTANGTLSAEIVVGTSPGGELGGTWASPTVDATHSGSTHTAATDTHIADITDVHDHGSLAGLTDDDHTIYRLESADHSHATTGLQAGQLDHGTALTGLTDDDHTQYRLESADHTHQSTGAQAGTLDHGLALTGLTDDDHTQYRLESESGTFTVGAFFETTTTLTTGIRPIWRAPFACTVTGVRGYVDTGTTTVINAGTGAASAEDFCSANITIDPADAWEAGTVNQNSDVASGETVSVEIVTAGTATQLTIQIDFTRP